MKFCNGCLCKKLLIEFGKDRSNIDGLSLSDNISGDNLRTIFLNGELLIDDTLENIKMRMK